MDDMMHKPRPIGRPSGYGEIIRATAYMLNNRGIRLYWTAPDSGDKYVNDSVGIMCHTIAWLTDKDMIDVLRDIESATCTILEEEQ